MSRILVNYNYNKTKDKYTLLDSGVVFADLPVAVMESEKEYHEPMAVNLDGLTTIVEKSEFLSKNRLFKLALDKDQNIIESEDGVDFYLPIGTDLSKLEYVDGKIVPKQETKEEEIKEVWVNLLKKNLKNYMIL